MCYGVKYNYFHMEQRSRFKPDPFKAENFYYNEEHDFCICPMGQKMQRIGTGHVKTAFGYISENARYRAVRCEDCPLRCRYLKAKGNRTIEQNHRLRRYRQKAKELLCSKEGLKHRGQRCIEPEAVFEQMKYNMNYKRFRHFGKDKVFMDISLTDMVRNMENGPALIEKWLRNKNTVEFLGIWEEMYNPDFNSPEFEGIKNEAGLNRFILSVKQWVEKTNSKGIIAKAGRYGGTYAHKDIAFEFATWVSPQFKLYLLKEFQRLKEEEQAQLGWSAKRELSKINYRIHTDAIRQNLIPVEVTPAQAGIIYAEEADVLNVAMFGMTARMWREQNPGLKGNIRDYASINELICLSNMENLNAVFIDQGIPQGERLVRLNRIAIQQMRVLEDDGGRKLLE